MKKLLSIVLFLSAMNFIPQFSEAAVLQGNVILGPTFSCSIWNTTPERQMVYQVEYEWTCDEGPQKPARTFYETTGCNGFCWLGPWQTGVSRLGPEHQDCKLIDAICFAYSFQN